MSYKIIKKIELLVNRTLALDPDTLKAISSLAGRTLSLEFVNTELVIFILPVENGFRLENSFAGEVDVQIRGTPANLINYLLSANGSGDGFTGKMEIIGDVGLAQQFQSIMKEIDLDWEEHLSHWVGDTLAHKLGNILRGGRKFVTDTRKTLELDVSEYLRYEKEILPEQSEVDEFNAAIDEIRNDAERLKLRVDRLNKTIQNRN